MSTIAPFCNLNFKKDLNNNRSLWTWPFSITIHNLFRVGIYFCWFRQPSFMFKKNVCLSICVVFSKVFYILDSLCAFIMYTYEDTSSLKFGGVVSECMCLCMCLCLCCVKLSYLLFVYGFENLMKINWVLFSICENAKYR